MSNEESERITTSQDVISRLHDKIDEQEARIAELEGQLEAIGAGGVEPLRRQPAAPQAVQVMNAQTIKHISALSELVRMPNAEHFADAHNAAVRHLRAIAAKAKE